MERYHLIKKAIREINEKFGSNIHSQGMYPREDDCNRIHDKKIYLSDYDYDITFFETVW